MTSFHIQFLKELVFLDFNYYRQSHHDIEMTTKNVFLTACLSLNLDHNLSHLSSRLFFLGKTQETGITRTGILVRKDRILRKSRYTTEAELQEREVVKRVSVEGEARIS
jgi:hypothetical protein